MLVERMEEALIERDVPTVNDPDLMTEEFMSIYRQALSFSELNVDTQIKFRNVAISDNDHMHEIYTVGDPSLPHLVLLHGFGGTALTFVRMFKELRNHFQVHALDTFGIGLSSRGNWNKEMVPEDVMKYYVKAVQAWRNSVGLSEFILAGHSFGGYISTLYFEQYPQRVKQLILLSPAGTARISEQMIEKRARNNKFFFWIAEKLYKWHIRPSRIIDTCWIGNKFMERVLTNRLRLPDDEKKIWKKYLKHISKQKESSEEGFYILFNEWPIQPIKSIETILTEAKPTIKIDFLYGSVDYMQPDGAFRLAEQFENIKVNRINHAGHQLSFDNPAVVSSTIISLV